MSNIGEPIEIGHTLRRHRVDGVVMTLLQLELVDVAVDRIPAANDRLVGIGNVGRIEIAFGMVKLVAHAVAIL